MRKRLKKIAAVMSLMTMGLSLFGCGDKKDDTESTEKAKTEDVSASENE